MKLLVVLILLNIQIGLHASTQHHIPKTGEDHGSHLPSIGSSLFDKIFSKKTEEGDVIYELPFPIGKLMNKISQKQGDFVHSMLPFSRSLQRPKGQAYSPLLHPRFVFAAKNSETSFERAKLFIGYVKKTDQLEVISYNDEAGRFEYQLVKNYSKNAEVFYANRGKCLSCHQGQAPIFSVPGWSDTDSGVMGPLIAAKYGIKGKNSQQNRQRIASKIFGRMPSIDAVGTFDSLVRESNLVARDERVWLIGCGKNDECRLGLLLNTLASNSREAKEYYQQARKIIENSDLSHQNWYSSMLRSSDIGALKVMMKYSKRGNGSPAENTAHNSEAILEIIGNIYKLNETDNPATLRKRSFTKTTLIPSKLTGFNSADISLLKKEVSYIPKAIIELYNEKRDLFGEKAINKPLFMWSLLERANSPMAAKYKKWLYRKTPPKKLFHGSTIPVFKKRELNVFARHCFQCHATKLRFPPQFLSGSENEVELKIKKLREKLIYKLERGLMPPDRKDRLLLEQSGDQTTLLDYLKGLR